MSERIGFMCRIDFECELGMVDVPVYPSLEVLKEKRTCIPGCGWVKVRVIKVEGEGEPSVWDYIDADGNERKPEAKKSST